MQAGSVDRPRLVVFRSLKHMEGQIVDDDASQTLVGVSTRAPQLRELELEDEHRQIQRARAAGKLLAERAKEKGIEHVVFDRLGYPMVDIASSDVTLRSCTATGGEVRISSMRRSGSSMAAKWPPRGISVQRAML